MFECSVTTIFICAFYDMENHKGAHMAPRLRDALGISAPDGEKSPPSPAKSPVRGQTSTSSATPSMDPELLQA